jgi:ice-binding like protein
MRVRLAMLTAGAGLAALLCMPLPALAQPGLGAAASYAVLGGSTITNRGATTIRGDVGVSPGLAITGLPFGQPSRGSVHAGDVVAARAQADVATVYRFLEDMHCTTTMCSEELGGRLLSPGVYGFSGGARMIGALELDARGDTAAVFVFQIANALTVAAGASVTLSNGAQARHVWWQVGSSATLGSSSVMSGNVLARTSITLKANAGLAGQALAQCGAVTMDTNSIVSSVDRVTATSRTTWGRIKSLYR